MFSYNWSEVPEEHPGTGSPRSCPIAGLRVPDATGVRAGDWPPSRLGLEYGPGDRPQLLAESVDRGVPVGDERGCARAGIPGAVLSRPRHHARCPPHRRGGELGGGGVRPQAPACTCFARERASAGWSLRPILLLSRGAPKRIMFAWVGETNMAEMASHVQKTFAVFRVMYV